MLFQCQGLTILQGLFPAIFQECQTMQYLVWQLHTVQVAKISRAGVCKGRRQMRLTMDHTSDQPGRSEGYDRVVW